MIAAWGARRARCAKCKDAGWPRLRVSAFVPLMMVIIGLCSAVKRADAQTADFIWDGGGANNLWMTAENWEGGVAPAGGMVDGVSRGRLIFSGESQTVSTNNFAADVSFYGITFTNDNSAGKTSAFALYRTASRKFYLRGHIQTLATASGTITNYMNLNMEPDGSSRHFIINQGHDLLFAGVLSGAYGSLRKKGGGELTVTGSNSYRGRTVLEGGTLSFNSIRNVSGGSSALGSPTNVVNATIELQTGTFLRYTGTGHSSDRVINLAGDNVTLCNDGTGALTLTGGITADSARNLLIGGNGEMIMSGVIAAPTHDLTYLGDGTLTLSNADNTYAGNTVVSAGKLVIGAAGAVSNSPVISVAAGATCDVSSVTGFTVGVAQTLAGNGTVTGNVILRGTLSAGEASGVGVLAADHFTFSSGSTVAVDVVGGVADRLSLSGGVTVEPNVNVVLTTAGDLPPRIRLVEAPLGIAHQENLDTWTVTGVRPSPRVAWDGSAQSIILLNRGGTVFLLF